jgi:hypothetical protein
MSTPNPHDRIDGLVALVNEAYRKVMEFGAVPIAGTEAQEMQQEGLMFFLVALEELTKLIREHGPVGGVATFSVVSKLSDQDDLGPVRFLAAQAINELASTEWAPERADEDEEGV